MFSNQDLRKLIIPLIFEQILAVTIGMADTVMVSTVGQEAISGVASVDSINILLINILSALATGGAVVASQYLGRKDLKNASQTAKQLIFVCTALASVFMMIVLLFGTPLLSFIFGDMTPEIMEHAKVYFFYSGLSYPFLAVYNSGAAVFRSMGNSKVSLYTALCMNLMNLVGNAILIYGFNMGVAGAAISTLVSRAAGAVIMIILLRNPSLPIHVRSLRPFKLVPGLIRRILTVGIPTGVENGLFQMGKLIVMRWIVSYGTAAIAANTAGGNLAGFAVIPGSAIGLAMVTVVGRCIGANEKAQAKAYAKKLLKLAYLSMFVLNIILVVSLPLVLLLYKFPTETYDLAYKIIVLHSIFAIVFWPTSFALPNTLRAANDSKFTMIVSFSSMFIFRVLLSYVLGTMLGMGVIGIWLAMFSDWIVRAIFFAWRFRSDKWLTKTLL